MNTKSVDLCNPLGKLEVSPEFVKEVHKAACATWKKKIEEEFPCFV